MDSVCDFQAVADVFKQLGDATRVRIFWLLCHQELCVSDIAALLNMTCPAISHHLRILKDCAFITGSRIGKEVYYKASDSLQAELMHQMIEKVMEISCPDRLEEHETIPAKELAGYQAEQIEIIKQVHDDLLTNLDTRVTIDSLAKKYHINQTTLKSMFKTVYGDSLAAHMKTHRLEEAAKLLTETNYSLAEISKMIGYENQSKFSQAFKEHFKILPKDYRKEKK